MFFLQLHTLRIRMPAILCASLALACARKDETPQRVDSLGQILAAIPDSAMRQRWRALLLVIKAKLESVESGI